MNEPIDKFVLYLSKGVDHISEKNWLHTSITNHCRYCGYADDEIKEALDKLFKVKEFKHGK